MRVALSCGLKSYTGARDAAVGSGLDLSSVPDGEGRAAIGTRDGNAVALCRAGGSDGQTAAALNGKAAGQTEDPGSIVIRREPPS